MTHSVYRFYDAAGSLLYVGSTGNVPLRAVQHRDKPWWSEVATSTVEHFDSQKEARVVEQSAIEKEAPRYNTFRAEGKTPLRSFRIPDDLYRRAQARAAEKGETVSEAVRKFLERYAR